MKRSIFYDTEFLDTGSTIELISIGLIDTDGYYYYAINSDAPWGRIVEHSWLMSNVVPQLPMLPVGHPSYNDFEIPLDVSHDDVRTLECIADNVADFILDGSKVDLWAWYSAYDHVRLMQLWGRMVPDVPRGIPNFTMDLRQEVQRLGLHKSDLPSVNEAVEHNALDDATWDWHVAGRISFLNDGKWPIDYDHYRKVTGDNPRIEVVTR